MSLRIAMITAAVHPARRWRLVATGHACFGSPVAPQGYTLPVREIGT
ncbi:hypothetical protein [Antarctobacter sp.]